MGSERIDTAALRARADLARNHPEVRRPKAVEVMALCDEADRLNARLAEVEQALRTVLGPDLGPDDYQIPRLPDVRAARAVLDKGETDGVR